MIFKKMCNTYMYMKVYTFDEKFFDLIDCETKAYILGFLFADGYNDEKRAVISLSLQERDREILDKMSIIIGSTKPLQFIDMKKYHKEKSHQNQYRLNLCSKYTSQKLSQIGCKQNKSYCCRFPSIADDLIPHFMRGYFDGDGCISYTYNSIGNPCGSVSFVGSSYFCGSIRNILKIMKINCKVFYPKSYDKRIRRLSFGGRKQLQKFYNFIYKNATIYLSRKRMVFDDFIEKSISHLVNKKSYNVYKNVSGCKLPFRVVKTINYKSITIGTYPTYDTALKASMRWDKDHGRSVELLYKSTSS